MLKKLDLPSPPPPLPTKKKLEKHRNFKMGFFFTQASISEVFRPILPPS